jgi:hypothetical protein
MTKKKNFKSGIDGLLQASTPEKKINKKNKINSDLAQVKATYFFETKQLDDIKAIAYYERKSIGLIIDEALKKFTSRYNNLDEATEIHDNTKDIS